MRGAMMVASSRSSSLRHSVRPPPQQQEPQHNGAEDNISKDNHKESANMHATKAAAAAAIIASSKSLPNLKNKTSSSPPPPRRSGINNNHHHNHHRVLGAAQTTLDSFLKRDTQENDEQPPAKKARRMNNNINTNNDTFNHNNITTTTTTTTIAAPPKQPLQSRDSPDPLNTLTTTESLRARARANTFNTAATTSPTRSTTTRSTRHGERKPVIIADDDDVSRTGDLPSAAGIGEGEQKKVPEKRLLRSHDGGSRSKSELAMYFPSYEQIISLEPVKPEFLAPETTVALMDDLTESPLPPLSSSLEESSPSRTRKQRKSSDQISPFGNPLLELHQVEKVELAQVDNNSDNDDPLSDDIYFKAHRRHERQEKQLRNIEKERAQHEKIQLDRLLDELQGHDWLRVMGISGITDTEKKLYEPKRDHFVREVTALIDKFRIWKEEEKRRKTEREQTALEVAADHEEEEEDDEEEEEVQPSSSDNQSYGTPPDPNDVDAWAARQLLQEARSASSANGHAAAAPTRRRLVDELTGSPPTKPRSQKQPQKTQKPPPPPSQEQREPSEELEPKPFVSFYPKRHLRDAALSARRGGRNRSAFGQPLPEIEEEREFRLPSFILTDDVIHATERKRRRLKRESRG